MKTTNTIHIKYMKKCLTLAEQALANGDPPVGSIIIYQNQIIGTGIEAGKSTKDVTNHAEILAVKNALANGHGNFLAKSTLYSTHEPCFMCSYVIRHHALSKIILGIAVEHVGGYTSEFKVLSTKQVPQWKSTPEVIFGICEEDCLDLNRRFKEKTGILAQE